VPTIVPPLLSLGVALAGLYVYSGGLYNCARLAFVSATLGTIIGTSLINILRMRKLSTSIISIGGFGSFDGIFLAGLLSTIVACLLA
jgi:uncharacterized membrane protein